MRRFLVVLGWWLLPALLGGPLSSGTSHAREEGYSASIAFGDLPFEAQRTLRLIQLGGPFPYPRKDGSVFNNFERRLPVRPRGYYLEYTVSSPESRDRGPRRIVAGRGDTRDVKTSNEYYYTDDHYRHFSRIREIP